MKKIWIVSLIAAMTTLVLAVSLANAKNVTQVGDEGFTARLSGFNEVPPKLSDGTGHFRAQLVGDTIQWQLSYSNMSTTVTAAHIHFAQPGVNGGIVVNLCGAGSAPACPNVLGPVGTATPTATETATETPIATETATETPIPTETATETPVPTVTATITPFIQSGLVVQPPLDVSQNPRAAAGYSGMISGTISMAEVLALPEQGVNAGNLFGLLRAMLSGDTYVNVHTTQFPEGELRGQVRFFNMSQPGSADQLDNRLDNGATAR